MLICVFLILLMIPGGIFAQQKDSAVLVDGNYIELSDIVVNRGLDVASFIRRVEGDTTFFKAFKNLRVTDYTASNDIKMLGKKDQVIASLTGKTRQIVQNHCRRMDIVNQAVTGNFFDKNGDYNYYTAAMYAQLFFTKGTICNETNIIGNPEIQLAGLSGMEKHKAQLKMLFFNPGKRISGLPLISNKTAIFDREMIKNYDMKIGYEETSSGPAYVFHIKVKKGKENKVVINEMSTWFDIETFEVLAKNYSLSYNTGIYDFNVRMNVKMTRSNGLLLPAFISYHGNWKIMMKKREKGVFTANLSSFAPRL